MKKKQLRQQMREKLNQLSEPIYKERSLMIQHHLFQELHIIEGKTIAITMSNRPEVDTIGIIEQLWRLNKCVVVPRCIPSTRDMLFYEITNFQQLERVYMDILEPIPHLTKQIEKSQIDCIIVPGIVFDPSGYRVGFGGGYYDRYLQNFSGTKISLAFDEQVIDQVPHEKHDIPTEIIITDKKRIVCKSIKRGIIYEVND